MQIALKRAVIRAPRLTLDRLRDVFAHWRIVARERQRLARLDARMLRDIGLTEAEAQSEAARPFWDAAWR